MRYFLEFSYHGKPYHGWQKQPNALSVQQVLENALSTLLRLPITVIGAGRTDTGVHAKQMFAHFDVALQPCHLKHLVYQLNQYLGASIAIHHLKPVIPNAHARFDATSRTYEYHIVSKKVAFHNDLHYFFKPELNMADMNAAAAMLFQYNDFKCFSKSNTDVKTFNCEIYKAKWKSNENGYIFTIQANRFLRNMVRAIVGTLLNVGQGKINQDDFSMIIESKNRSQAGFSVPAHGLFLSHIAYPKSIYL